MSASPKMAVTAMSFNKQKRPTRKHNITSAYTIRLMAHVQQKRTRGNTQQYRRQYYKIKTFSYRLCHSTYFTVNTHCRCAFSDLLATVNWEILLTLLSSPSRTLSDSGTKIAESVPFTKWTIVSRFFIIYNLHERCEEVKLYSSK